jgi:hypothetical protein
VRLRRRLRSSSSSSHKVRLHRRHGSRSNSRSSRRASVDAGDPAFRGKCSSVHSPYSLCFAFC